MNYLKKKETIPFTIVSKTIRYLGIHLTKEFKDLFSENCKKLMNEIEDIDKWKYIPYSWIERILSKCPYYPKPSIYSMQSLSRFQWHFSLNLFLNPKISLDPQKTPNSYSILKRRTKLEASHSDFKLYYKTVVIKIVCYWYKKKDI